MSPFETEFRRLENCVLEEFKFTSVSPEGCPLNSAIQIEWNPIAFRLVSGDNIVVWRFTIVPISRLAPVMNISRDFLDTLRTMKESMTYIWVTKTSINICLVCVLKRNWHKVVPKSKIFSVKTSLPYRSLDSSPPPPSSCN